MKTFLILLATLFLSACDKKADQITNGYVEAEYVRVASPVAGRLIQLAVQRGDQVNARAPLFVLDQDSEAAAVQESAAMVKKAEAQASDLAKGKRPDEIAAIHAQIEMAKAALRQSESELQRQRKLSDSGFVSPATLTTLQAKRDADAAQIRELEAQVRVANSAARVDNRVAAQAETAAARAQLAQSQWRLTQKTVISLADARVDDTFYRVGEWVPAGSPVVSLMTTDAIKIRFFVAEAVLPKIKTGNTVSVSCDGCGPAVLATVRYIAKQAEFTPPVIYSKENRQRLVFLVEAWPSAADATRLHPGQPVDVRMDAEK